MVGVRARGRVMVRVRVRVRVGVRVGVRVRVRTLPTRQGVWACLSTPLGRYAP